MAGVTPERAALAAAVIGFVFPQLRGSNGRAYDADLRVLTLSGLTTYPDVTIVCDATTRDAEDQQAITNPMVIVEVLSRSTEGVRPRRQVRALQVSGSSTTPWRSRRLVDQLEPSM